MTARTAVQGHRGSVEAGTGIRENTLEAFELARRLGADGIEFDVRMTLDGAVAVHHDPVIGDVGAIAGLRADELPPYVPLLPEVLATCPALTLNVEIKDLPGEPGFDPDDGLVLRVLELLAEADRASGVVLSSFWPPSLEAVRRAAPDLHTGLLVAEWFDPSGAVDAALARGCSALHPHRQLVSAALVEEAHRVGLDVTPWTVNDRSHLLAMVALGVDTVITDDVPVARAACGPGGHARDLGVDADAATPSDPGS